MSIEDTMNRMELLGSRIMEGRASKLEVLEWIELTSNGNPIKEKAIQLLKDSVTSGDSYSNGYFDGFTEAKNIVESGGELSSYKPNKIAKIACWVKENFVED